MSRRLVGIAIIYALSVGSLFIAESLLISFAQPAEYGAYRLAVNAAPLIALGAALGNESAIARLVAERRRPVRWGRMQTRRVSIALLLGCSFGAYGFFAFSLGLRWAFGVSLLAALLVITNFFSAVQRSAGRSVMAAWTQQGYRLLGGICIICAILIGLVRLRPILLLVFAAAVCATIGFVWNYRLNHVWVPSRDDNKWISRVGPGFALSGITMAALDLLDQLIVAQLAGVGASGEYAALKLYVVFPIISISSILAFVALPTAVRFVETADWHAIGRAFRVGITASAIAAGIFGSIGIAAYTYLTGNVPDIGLAVAFIAIGTLRLYYTVPVSILSALTDASDIRRLGYVGAGGLIIICASPIALLLFPGVSLTLVIALSLVICYASRVVAATILCRRAYMRGSE